MRIKVSPGTVSGLGLPLVKALASSWRYDVRHAERWRALRERREGFIYALWHEQLLPLTWLHRAQGVTMVVSEARDGQYLADLGAALGYRAVRGSSTRGGMRALLGAVRVLEEGGEVAFTPDGPRGPRREVKPGVVAAAQRAGAAIVPVGIGTARAWRLHSWDRMTIPKPFARIRVVYGAPIRVAEGGAGLERGVATLQAVLDEIAEGGDGTTG